MNYIPYLYITLLITFSACDRKESNETYSIRKIIQSIDNSFLTGSNRKLKFVGTIPHDISYNKNDKYEKDPCMREISKNSSYSLIIIRNGIAEKIDFPNYTNDDFLLVKVKKPEDEENYFFLIFKYIQTARVQ